MKRLTLCLILLVFCFVSSSFAQFSNQSDEQVKVIKAVSPTYIPAAALALKAEGAVDVEVKIDKLGKVKSAKAISGHKLLQKLSEIVAEQWIFNSSENAEIDRTAIITFVFHRVGSRKEENTSFFPPFRIELFYFPPEIITTPSVDPISITPNQKLPKVVKYFAPQIPPAANAVMASGYVVITVKIDKVGKVTSTKVESGHPLLRKASEEAAKKWLFSKDKTATEREVKLTFLFDSDSARNKKDEVRFKKPYLIIIKRKPPTIS